MEISPNSGSLFGYFVQLHVGKAIPNFYMAECDPLNSNVITTEGYDIEEGMVSVPDSPGFGLKINENKFSSSPDIEILFDLKI